MKTEQRYTIVVTWSENMHSYFGIIPTIGIARRGKTREGAFRAAVRAARSLEMVNREAHVHPCDDKFSLEQFSHVLDLLHDEDENKRLLDQKKHPKNPRLKALSVSEYKKAIDMSEAEA